jgi:hypothetical protein
MGARLVEIVERVRQRPDGMPSVDLARLNLRVGKAISRMAATLADDPDLVERAQRIASEILAGV